MLLITKKNMDLHLASIIENMQAQLSKQNDLILAMADKAGYTLEETSENVYEFKKDESEQTTSGDYLNPIPYTLNMEVQENLWYTDGDNIWECIKSGMPDDFNDKEYFDIIGL